MNPVIYNYINRSFRREFYALYPCCCKSTTSSSAVVSSRLEMPSVITKRIQRQEPREIEDNIGVLITPPMNKSGARFVTFADGEKNGKASLVLVNEHI
jgi:hypothetical protein